MVNDPHTLIPRGIGSCKAMRGAAGGSDVRKNSTGNSTRFFGGDFFLGDDEVINRTWGRGFMYIKITIIITMFLGIKQKIEGGMSFYPFFLGKQNGKMRGLMRGLKTQLPDPKKTLETLGENRAELVPQMPGKIQGYG